MTLFSSPPREETLQGTVESVVYQSADGFFSVVRVLLDRDGSETTVIGDLGSVSPGESLRFRGRFAEHPVHGKRFQVSSFTPVLPQSAQGITRYLGSGLIPGIGRASPSGSCSNLGIAPWRSSPPNRAACGKSPASDVSARRPLPKLCVNVAMRQK